MQIHSFKWRFENETKAFLETLVTRMPNLAERAGLFVVIITHLNFIRNEINKTFEA